MTRKTVYRAQGRNGYMGVDVYAKQPDGRLSMLNNLACIKPLGLGRNVADLLNNAYARGVFDATGEWPEDNDSGRGDS